MFRLLKLLRVRRLSTLIANLQQPMQTKSQLKRLFVVFILVLICHIQGCFIYFQVVTEQIWIPPTDFGAIKTDVFEKERGFLFRYMKVFYHSSLTYSMVDISTRTANELGFMIFLILISAIINAIVFGQFSLLTEELKRDSNDFLNKLNLINSVMASENLPQDIRH